MNFLPPSLSVFRAFRHSRFDQTNVGLSQETGPRADLAAELLDLSIDGAFSLWRWLPATGRIETFGKLAAGTFQEWIDGIHPDDTRDALEFLEAALIAGGLTSFCEYRWRAGGRGDWLLICHTLRKPPGEVAGAPCIEGLVEMISAGASSLSLLDVTERDLREGEIRMAEFFEGAFPLAGAPDPLPLLRLLKHALRADTVAYLPLDVKLLPAGTVAATSPDLTLDLTSLRNSLVAIVTSGGHQVSATSEEIDLEEGKIRFFLAKPVLLPGSGVSGAICAGFVGADARALVRRFECLLTFTATLFATRLGQERWTRHCRDLLGEVREARCRGNAMARAARAAATVEEKITHAGSAMARLLPAHEGNDSDVTTARDHLAEAKEALSKFRESVHRRPSLHSTDLNKLVERTVAMIDGVLMDSVSLVLDLDQALEPVICDEAAFREALLILILEAHENSVERGILTLSTRWTARKDRTGKHHATFWLSYLSKGGFREEGNLSREDDPVLLLLSASGIEVERSRDARDGVSIRLSFPSDLRSQSRNAGDSLSRNRLGAGELRGTRVLLVEDQLAVRKLVRKLLETLGCEVTEVGSGREALELWPTVQDQVSMVISDVVMPGGVSGWDLAKELHHRHPDLSILLTSGHAAELERYGLEDRAEISFLQKPYGVDTLRESMLGLLNVAVA